MIAAVLEHPHRPPHKRDGEVAERTQDEGAGSQDPKVARHTCGWGRAACLSRVVPQAIHRTTSRIILLPASNGSAVRRLAEHIAARGACDGEHRRMGDFPLDRDGVKALAD